MADTLEYSDVGVRARPLRGRADRGDPQVRAQPAGDQRPRRRRPREVIIKHLYIERRMIPLNIYLQEAFDAGAEHARAGSRSSARSSSTATRSRTWWRPTSSPATCCGRTSASRATARSCSTTTTRSNTSPTATSARCRTRATRKRRCRARSGTRSARKDVFPETFEPFLLGNPAVREVFMKHHADLLDAAFWQSHKERILAGHVHDVFPYEREKRFARRHAAREARRSWHERRTDCARRLGTRQLRRHGAGACRSPSLSSPGSSARSATTRKKRATSCSPTPTTIFSRSCWPIPTCTCEPTSRCRIPRPSRTSACW